MNITSYSTQVITSHMRCDGGWLPCGFSEQNGGNPRSEESMLIKMMCGNVLRNTAHVYMYRQTYMYVYNCIVCVCDLRLWYVYTLLTLHMPIFNPLPTH